eukprot:gene11640-4881_t
MVKKTETKKVTKKTKPHFLKRNKLNPKAPKECDFEVTIGLRKILRGTRLKTRAARAMREIKKYVRANFGTTDVRLDPSLNKFVWSNGTRSVPSKVRLLLSRRPIEDEDKKGKFYTLVNNMIVSDFTNLRPKRVVSSSTE